MKIAIVTQEYPDEVGGGGIGTYVFLLSHNLAEKGHAVTIFCETKNETLILNKNNNLQLVKISTTKNDFKAAVKCYFIDNKLTSHFDIIETAEYGATTLELQEIVSTPVLVKLHAPTFIIQQFYSIAYSEALKSAIPLPSFFKFKLAQLFKGKKYRYQKDPEYIVSKQAHYVISPSKALAMLINKHWKINNIEVIPNLINKTNHSNTLENKKWESDIINIVSIGKLSFTKGTDLIYKAIPEVLDNNPNVRFHFIGSPLDSLNPNYDMRDYFYNVYPQYKRFITFHGFINYSEIPDLINKMHVLLITSYFENWPYIIFEGMANNLCIIANKVGGIPEIINNNQNGLIVKKQTSRQISKTILRTVSNKEQMQRIALNAFNSYLSYNNNELINKTVAAYHKAISIFKNGSL